MASMSNSASAHKPILAERFKSRMCKNFEDNGSCPYEERCMFAHGEHELRSKEMNLADNLVTEEAIKAFQKARAIANRSAQKKRERDAMRTSMKESTESPRAGAPAQLDVEALTPLPREESTSSIDAPLSPSHTTNKTYVMEYDETKYVSPLAAAMLCRPKLVDSCHCASCRVGTEGHDIATADTILLA